MDGEEIQECAADIAARLPLAERDFPFGPEIEVYRVGGKIFVLLAAPYDRPLVNVKVDPEHAVALRQTVAGIEAGWHMNKKHWISLTAAEDITVDLVEELVHESYELVVESLPHRIRPIEYRFRPVLGEPERGER